MRPEDLLEVLPEAHLLLGLDGLLAGANRAVRRLLGAPLAEGQRLHELAADPAEHVDELLRRWAGSSSPRPGALTLVAGDEEIAVRVEGVRIPGTRMLLVRVREHPRAVEPFVAVANEVERRNLREMRDRLQRSLEELRAANRRLERTNVELERYAGVVSHDLRTPLATIAGYVDLLRADHYEQLDDGGRETIAVIERATARMHEVIRALLELARITEPPEVAGASDPRAAAAEVAEQLASEMSAHGAELDISDDLPAVEVDPTHLVQLLQNLVGNSLKFRHPERAPRIEISGERRGEVVALRVADNGVGVPADERESIFELLERGAAAAETSGSGIGLATCRKLAELYGGSITSHEPGSGSGAVFEVTLPAPPR